MAEVSQTLTVDDVAINQAFSTQSKARFLRGHGVVRQKAIRFLGALQRLGYVHEVPLEKAKDIFQLNTDTWDRASLKAYFGQLPGRSERIIDRTAHYATGTISIKKIKLRQDIQKKEGYLEKLGLVHYELRGRIWFLLVNEASVVPEIAKSSTSVQNEAVKASIDNFSLTPKGPGQPKAERNDSGQPSTILRLQRRERVTERERNRLSESILSSYLKPELTPKHELTPSGEAAIEERDRKRAQAIEKTSLNSAEKGESARSHAQS